MTVTIQLTDAFGRERRFTAPAAPQRVRYRDIIFARQPAEPGDALTRYVQVSVFEIDDAWRVPDEAGAAPLTTAA